MGYGYSAVAVVVSRLSTISLPMTYVAKLFKRRYDLAYTPTRFYPLTYKFRLTGDPKRDHFNARYRRYRHRRAAELDNKTRAYLIYQREFQTDSPEGIII